MTSPKISPNDPRYDDVLSRRFNKRFSAHPDYVRPVSSTTDVIAAVGDAVGEGRRLVVTSGGQCLEGFVSDPEVRAMIDISPMKRIEFDAERRAVMVEAGATVGESYRTLCDRWGVVVPLGEYPKIGTGGHVAGGAFGFLCRQLGLAVDHLYGVEVVTVDVSGRARSVVATCEPSDSNRELWWAHTGGGAGNFGIVTRHWFRSPNAIGETAESILPRAPTSVTTFTTEVRWDHLDPSGFRRLVRQFGSWCERNSAAGSPGTSLWLLLELHRKQLGKIIVRGVSTADSASADRQIREVLSTLGSGSDALAAGPPARLSWLDFALNPFPDMFAMPPGGVRVKVKDALLKRPLSDRQIDCAYHHLTRTDCDVMGGMLGLATYGGRINAVAPDATATAHRDSIFDVACNTGWVDPRAEAENLAWVRAFYRDLFADSGGVPVPGDVYGGTYINHPDVDLVVPDLNTSGVPWHTLYYRDNYPRLMRVKAQWDPRNVFHHALSVR